ncbi:hypothetical protein [Planotetraspora phitsanulokensis]|uniref:hypothetical protein n=1 Tax=Planotetraspora phitsanulokensis TaxID=575192 RepID=UPI00195028D8|nr:hypothetical protein [Planotetraspora phitsanulokensis]
MVLGAVPEGMRPAGSQQEFVRAVKEHPDALALRCHGYRNLMQVATALSNWADWTTLTTRPTEQRIAEEADLALSTVKRWVRWLRERGFLGTVEEGTTVRYRKGTRMGLDDDGLGNRAAVWVLCVPSPQVDDVAPVTDKTSSRTDRTTTEPPSVTLPERVTEGPTHARETRSSRRKTRISPTSARPASPGTKRHALQTAEQIRDTSTTLRRLSPWYIRHLTRVFLVAGWTADDVLHALDHKPDGTAWTYTWQHVDDLRHIPGWVKHRLAAWLDVDGRPVASKSQRLDAAAAKVRSEQEAWRAQRESLNAARVGGPLELAPRLTRAEALAPQPVVAGVAAAGPSAAYRAARAVLARRPREVERWALVDAAAQDTIEAQRVLVEAPAPKPVVEDEELRRRQVVLARARMRARSERERPAL